MSAVLKVLIADDEQMARKRLTRLLAALPGVEICGECENAEAVLFRVHQGGVDAVLLDINMPGLSGVEAMSLLPAGGPLVIFCTAHPDHAIAAFDGGAIDYLLKPIEAARLAKALDRAHERLASRRAAPTAGMQKLAVTTRQGIVLVPFDDISHALHDGVLVTLHTTEAALLTDFTLQQLQEQLPAGRFERVHRRALLNLDHVARLEPQPTGGYIARTHKGHTIEVSRAAARGLRRRLGLRKANDEEDPGAEE